MKKYYRKNKGRLLKGVELKNFLARFELFFLFVFSVLTAFLVVFGFFWIALFSACFLVLFAVRYWFHFRVFKAYRSIDELIDSVDGSGFEYWVAGLLRKMGYTRVKVVGAKDCRGDGGIDVVGYSPDGYFTVVQCKRLKSWVVSVNILRDFLGAVVDFKADRGLFITTAIFSQKSREFARRYPQIALIDKGRLALLLEKFQL